MKVWFGIIGILGDVVGGINGDGGMVLGDGVGGGVGVLVGL